jgi:hypothetical protein
MYPVEQQSNEQTLNLTIGLKALQDFEDKFLSVCKGALKE